MAQYIDKDALVAEIEKLKGQLLRGACSSQISMQTRCKEESYDEVLSFLDTLEVKEEILDKEGKTKLMRKCVHKAYKRGYDMGVLQTTNKMNHNTKEVDLDFMLHEYWNLSPKITIDCLESATMTKDEMIKFAKHFFELGLKAQKGE